MRWLDGDQLIGPVSLAIVMTIQARFVIAAQESLLRIFGGALDRSRVRPTKTLDSLQLMRSHCGEIRTFFPGHQFRVSAMKYPTALLPLVGKALPSRAGWQNRTLMSG